MENTWDLQLHALRRIPFVESGDDLGAIAATGLHQDGIVAENGDVLVIAQKVVSKAEGRVVRLADVDPSPRARELAEQTGRNPALCQLYLDESSKILGVNGRHVITLHRLGFEGTGAGVDMSNATGGDEPTAVLLPVDPDASAQAIRARMFELTGARLAVIVSDSFGSPTRQGAIGAAIGVAGIAPVEQPEETDLFGRPSRPMINRVDELAGAASILMGQSGQAKPMILIRGAPFTEEEDAGIEALLIDRS
ncbi:MAG: coenzyme F420-0:L-glutamate ligase [Solirubrobacterales bacterium]